MCSSIVVCYCFFFKQKTAYEMRISDWSSDVCSSDLGARSPKPGIDFFPLTVNYQEKTFAAGKIPGGFFKREGRPTEKEVLTSRLIDRPIRPQIGRASCRERVCQYV